MAAFPTKDVFADFIERAGWTAGQSFLATLLTSATASGVVDVPWKLALAMASGAAIVSLVATALQYLGNQTNLAFWPDLAVRLFKTFLASMAGSFGADVAFNVLAFDWSSAFDLAVVTTLAALAKCLLARQPQTTLDVDGKHVTASPNPSTLPASSYKLAIEARS